MPAKPSGKIRTCTVKVKQKNGDRYVVERQIRYNPDTKNNQVLHSKLIGKIPAGSEEMIPTRSRRKKAEAEQPTDVCAPGIRAGMTDILDHVGKASGVDALLYENTDPGTARKIISIARYLAATDGASLSGIESFQLARSLPYAEEITEDVRRELFRRVGCDETLQRAFFLGRAKGLGGRSLLAYDCVSASAFSRKVLDVEGGDGPPSVRFLLLCSPSSGQPVAFRKLDGGVADATTVASAVRRLSDLGAKSVELVTDDGYYAEYNIADMCEAGLRFITPVRTRCEWVREAIDAHRGELQTEAACVPFDRGTRGVCVEKTRTFRRPRLRAGRGEDLKKMEPEEVTKRAYLHLYFNGLCKAEEDAAFDNRLHDARDLLMEGTPVEELSTPMQILVADFLVVKRRAGKTSAGFNDEAIRERKKYHGFFALLADQENDPFRVLRIYRRREGILEFFRLYDDIADGERPRVWSGDMLQGRMFVQFVALCYREYLAARITDLEASLGVRNGDPVHDAAENLEAETMLRNWLKERSLNQILRWFEPGDRADISAPARRKRFSSEIKARDALLLEKLGMKS